jgi:hypothetical protein
VIPRNQFRQPMQYVARLVGTATLFLLHGSSVAKFIVADWGAKVDSGIGLSYRSARLDNPLPESIKSPSQGL